MTDEKNDDTTPDAGAAKDAGASPEGTPASAAGNPGDGSAADTPQDIPGVPREAREDDERIFGINVHNLIFVGMLLGVLIGWIVHGS